MRVRGIYLQLSLSICKPFLLCYISVVIQFITFFTKLGLCSIRQVTILVCYLHLRCRNIGCSCDVPAAVSGSIDRWRGSCSWRKSFCVLQTSRTLQYSSSPGYKKCKASFLSCPSMPVSHKVSFAITFQSSQIYASDTICFSAVAIISPEMFALQDTSEAQTKVLFQFIFF